MALFLLGLYIGQIAPAYTRVPGGTSFFIVAPFPIRHSFPIFTPIFTVAFIPNCAKSSMITSPAIFEPGDKLVPQSY